MNNQMYAHDRVKFLLTFNRKLSFINVSLTFRIPPELLQLFSVVCTCQGNRNLVFYLTTYSFHPVLQTIYRICKTKHIKLTVKYINNKKSLKSTYTISVAVNHNQLFILIVYSLLTHESPVPNIPIFLYIAYIQHIQQPTPK